MIDLAWVRLRADGARYWAATGISVVVTALGIAAALIGGAPAEITASSVAVWYFVAWIGFCLLYSWLTWRVLHLADGATLADWLRESEGQRRSRLRSESSLGTGGPSGAVMFCVIALAAVLLIAALPELRENPAALGLGVAVVAVTWLLLAVVYTLHYAREYTARAGLAFPGLEDRQAPVFLDFVYVAVLVATSFATADVSVRTTVMRREVTIHALIAFTFNTVIIALLVSLMLTVRE